MLSSVRSIKKDEVCSVIDESRKTNRTQEEKEQKMRMKNRDELDKHESFSPHIKISSLW
jgi:hypothetical protein